MFDVNLECGIRAVKVKVSETDGRVLRSCQVTLSHEFTSDIARALGGSASKVRAGLLGADINKAELPIDGLKAGGVFSGRDGETVEIGAMLGLKAVATRPKRETDGPTIQMEFEFVWNAEAWNFLGAHCASVADVLLTRTQLGMAYEDGAPQVAN